MKGKIEIYLDRGNETLKIPPTIGKTDLLYRSSVVDAAHRSGDNELINIFLRNGEVFSLDYEDELWEALEELLGNN